MNHIRPEFLLTYKRYLIFKERIIDEDNVEIEESLTEDDFNIFSKVLWTELILRIYKKFAFDRILSPANTKQITEQVFYSDFSKYFTTKLDSIPDDCNENEYKLMKWVEFHFNKQKHILLPEEFALPREINSLDAESIDTIAIMSIVITYCPYTLKCFKDIVPVPDQIFQNIYNSLILKNVLEKLKLSYRFRNFVDSRSDIEQIILLTYLFSVLPSFYPEEVLNIKANIGETGLYQISLRNVNITTVSYAAIFFGNELEEFDIDQKTITLGSKQSKIFKITYSAKDVQRAKAVLVLSGERPGQKYSKTKVYSLIGIPDVTYFTDEFTLSVQLYKPSTHRISLVSPCAKDYIARTYLYIQKTCNYPDCTNNLAAISKINEIRLPREIVIEDACVFDENGFGTVTIKTCLVAFSQPTLLLYFINNDAGIFCVKVDINCKMEDKLTETIFVRLATNFSPKEKCKCKTESLNIMCPLVFYIEVPCRNYFLMTGLGELFRNFAGKEEVDFWAEHLGKSILLFLFLYLYSFEIYRFGTVL